MSSTISKLTFETGPASKNSLMPIIVENLSLALNDRVVIDGISCQIKAAGISVIMGPNGAGKSLFMRCLHGVVSPQSGKISYAGKPLDTAIRKQQSLVFQTPILLRRTVLANLNFVARQRGATDQAISWDYLERLHLAPLANHPARLLSGGEKQRLALARALITSPAVLFLDEATSNLDPASVQMIETVLDEARRRGTKIIIITHDIGQAKRLADDVLFLHRGRLCEHSSAKSFFNNPTSPEAKKYLGGKLVL